MKSGPSVLVAALLLVAVIATAAAGALALGIVPPFTGFDPTATPSLTATPPASPTASLAPTPSPSPSTSPSPSPSPPPSDQPRPSPGGIHVVQQGEYLSTIAELYGVPWELIAQANGLVDPYTIYPGDELLIPAPDASPSIDPCARTYIVQPGDTFFDIAYELGVSADEMAALNDIEDVNTIYAGQVLRVPGGDDCPSPSASTSP